MNYLIPTNTKRSMLILGFFNALDLIVFGLGVGTTIILLISLNAQEVYKLIIIILPAAIATFLVLPLPNHHNVLAMLGSIYDYITKRRTYIWKGWCIYDEQPSATNTNKNKNIFKI